MTPELVTTEDGSHTLYNRDLDEPYHSIHGAITESRHVFIEAGLKSIPGSHLEIFEMGFGTGLNALLTLEEIKGSGKTVHYTALEKFPLGKEIIGRLNYGNMLPPSGKDDFLRIHECPWNRDIAITDYFILTKIRSDILSLEFPREYDLIYYDAFAPEKQPELWSAGIFSRIHGSMSDGAILTTYSSKGQVRRNLAGAGFRVEKLAGPPGKREMTRARKD